MIINLEFFYPLIVFTIAQMLFTFVSSYSGEGFLGDGAIFILFAVSAWCMFIPDIFNWY